MEVAGRQQSVLSSFVEDGWDWMSSKPVAATQPTRKLQPQIPDPVHGTEKKDRDGFAVRSDCSSVPCRDRKQDVTSISPSDSDSHRPDHSSIATSHGTVGGGASNLNNREDSGTGRSKIFVKQSTDEASMAQKDFEIRRIFNTYDENSDGQISEAELGSCMKKLDLDASEDAISTMMSSADKNGDGMVDFEEFVALQQTPSNGYSNGSIQHGKKNKSSSTTSLVENGDDPDITLLKETFSVFDTNHDGFISNIELHSILQRLGIKKGASLKDCQMMIASIDRNGDGRVDFEEFKALMTESTLWNSKSS